MADRRDDVRTRRLAAASAAGAVVIVALTVGAVALSRPGAHHPALAALSGVRSTPASSPPPSSPSHSPSHSPTGFPSGSVTEVPTPTGFPSGGFPTGSPVMVVDVSTSGLGDVLVTMLYPDAFCVGHVACVATLNVAAGTVGPLKPYLGALASCGPSVWPTATTSAYNRDPTSDNECMLHASPAADLRPGAAGWIVEGYDSRYYLELTSGLIVGDKPAPRPTQWLPPAVMPAPPAPGSGS